MKPIDNRKTRVPSDRIIETFTISKGVAGWYLTPSDGLRFPLLTRLYGLQGSTCPDVRQPLVWETLSEGLALLRSVAKDCHVGLRVCGDLRRRPVVQLWDQPIAAPEPHAKVFEGPGLQGDAAKWGVSDFYPLHEAALREALAGRRRFTTGWYGVKKEVQSGRVWRERANGQVFLEVSSSMDAWPDLVDTAIWAVRGKHLGAANGFDTLLKLGLSEGEAQTLLLRLVEEQSERAVGDDDLCATRTAKLAYNARYETVCERLDALMDLCEQELDSTYKSLEAYCEELLLGLCQERPDA